MKMKVILLRGFSGAVFSTGMDRLGEKIKNADIVVDGYESWFKHFTDLKDTGDRVVLIGHSFGALACYKIVSMLKHRKFPLVVTFDYSPYYSGLVNHLPDGVVPDNVIKAINFYQEVDPLVRGVKMKRGDKSEKGIHNVLTKYAHVEIDKADDLHDMVLQSLKNV